MSQTEEARPRDDSCAVRCPWNEEGHKAGMARHEFVASQPELDVARLSDDALDQIIRDTADAWGTQQNIPGYVHRRASEFRVAVARALAETLRSRQ